MQYKGYMMHVSICVNKCVCACAEMIHDWELYSVQQDVDPEEVRQNTEVAQGMVTWMRKLDLSPREPIATDESTEAHDCEDM